MKNLFIPAFVVIFYILHGLSASESKSNRCQHNWKTLNNSCIYVSNKTASWKHAEKKCKDMSGSKLVSIEDQKKNNQVVGILKNITNGSDAEFYIGLYVNKERKFRWKDGTPYNYSYWRFPNITNNITSSSDKKNPCAYYGADYKWMLNSCDHKRRFICQNNSLSLKQGRQNHCPQDWKAVNNSCIYVSNTTASWDDAKEKCNDMSGSKLVSIEDHKKNTQLVEILKNITNGSDAEFYIGLYVKKERKFEWMDGTPYNYSYWRFPNTTNTTTFPSDEKNLCAYFGADLKWMLNSCDHNRSFICQNNSPSLTPGPTGNNGSSSVPTTGTPTSNSTSNPTIRPTTGEVEFQGFVNNLSSEIKSNMTTADILKFVKKIEDRGKVIIDGIKKKGNITETEIVKINSTNVVVELAVIPSNKTFTVKFPSETSGGNILLPNSVIAVAQNFENNSDGVGITSVFLPDLGKTKDVLNSGVISTKVDAPSGAMQDLKDPVVISLPHGKALQGDDKPSCAFIDESTSNWSTAGCHVFSSNSSFTVCHCSHLTSFAVILDVHGTHAEMPEKHKFALLVVSIVGCCIALVCFVAALIAFHVIVSERRRRKTETISIHKNLAIAEIFALIFFLFAYIAVDSKGVCYAVSFLLHYFLMAVSFWMLIEGLNLHRGLVQVFVTSSRMKIYYVMGWVAPLIFVVSTAAVGGMEYAREDFCWISQQYIWVFAGPVAVILFINLIILCIAIRVMIKRPRYKMNQIDDASKSKAEQELRIAFKTTVILLPLLGLTWCLGFIATYSTTGNIVIQYLFAVINSLQGMYFFFAHCVYDEDVIRATSNTSTRIKSYFSRTLSNSGHSGSASLSNSKRTSAYCNASYEDGRVHEMPFHQTSKKGSFDSKASSTSNKTRVAVNGNPANGIGPHSPAKVHPKQNSDNPAPNVDIQLTTPAGFDAYFGTELKPTTEQHHEKTDDPDDSGFPNQQFFRRARSAIVKYSSSDNIPRRANSLSSHLGTRPPLSKQISSDSSQSGNSNTPILFSGY